jgi:hypothetical protein
MGGGEDVLLLLFVVVIIILIEVVDIEIEIDVHARIHSQIHTEIHTRIQINLNRFPFNPDRLRRTELLLLLITRSPDETSALSLVPQGRFLRLCLCLLLEDVRIRAGPRDALFSFRPSYGFTGSAQGRCLRSGTRAGTGGIRFRLRSSWGGLVEEP